MAAPSLVSNWSRVKFWGCSVRLAQRTRIVLLAAQGIQNNDIADALSVGRVQVGRWRDRYAQAGLPGIERDLPRGAPAVKVDVSRLVELTTQTKPEAATHWSTRKMAALLGVCPSTVMRHWQADGLKPHLVRGFKASRDPQIASITNMAERPSQRTANTLAGAPTAVYIVQVLFSRP